MRTRRAGGLALGCAIAMGACHRAPEEFSLPASSAEAIVAPSSGSKPDARPAQAEAPAAALPAAKLQIPDADPAPVTVEAEIAKSEHDSTRGLMYRTSMPEMHGMLFELERADHVFWMHNTCIPLDLLYIDGGHIVGIVESAPILNDDARSVGKMSNQVLELNAGFCKRHGVRIGQHVALSGKSG
jgi:hypothetical protein